MKTRNLYASSLLVLALWLGACTAPEVPSSLPPANPALGEPEGLSWLSRILMHHGLDFDVWRGERSGYVALFARDGHVVHAKVNGYANLEERLPMRLETRFRMASMTKPVTAVGAMILVQEGRLDLDAPVSRFIPEFASLEIATSTEPNAQGGFDTEPIQEPLLVRHLITFTSGIPYGESDSTPYRQLWEDNDPYRTGGSLADRIPALASLPLRNQPGEVWLYGLSADVLARVVEVAAEQPFDQFLRDRLFNPLDMKATSFLPPQEEQEGMAEVYTQNEDGDLVHVAQPEIDAPDWTPGGSGLVSNAEDYMRFALMLWNRGSFDGVQILKPETVADMTSLHVPSGVLTDQGMDGLGWGLGMAVVADADGTPVADRDGDFWWAGFYNTTFFVSPESGLVGVILSQNQPGPHSSLPLGLYGAQALAFFGL